MQLVVSVVFFDNNVAQEMHVLIIPTSGDVQRAFTSRSVIRDALNRFFGIGQGVTMQGYLLSLMVCMR